MNYCICDLEVDNRIAYKRKASPWHNEIVAAGFKYGDTGLDERDVGRFVGGPIAVYNPQEVLQEKWLNRVDLLVGHNIKFDLLYTWKYKYFQDWLKVGGQIFDTSVAEYMITGQQHKYPKLRDIAVNKYGCPKRIKHLDNLLFENKNSQYKLVSELPEELVLEDVRNDVIDTEQVFLQQLEIMERMKILPLFKGEMDALLATTEMEWNGIYCNRRVLEEHETKLEQRVQHLKHQLLEKVGKIL